MSTGERNVLGEPLEECGTDPMTGYYRTGCCSSDATDTGSHTICTVVTQEFLDQQVSVGNDLVTPRPQWDFAGLRPGDRWCVVAARWLQAAQAGVVAPVVLAATHERALRTVPLEMLRSCAVDVPDDVSSLE